MPAAVAEVANEFEIFAGSDNEEIDEPQNHGYNPFMRSRVSAGILMFRIRQSGIEVFLAHPGGPFFAHRDYGHWTIPKGEIETGEDHLSAAIREFGEEVGIDLDRSASILPLGSIRQKGGKIVHGWAVEGDWDDATPIRSNTFECEWPLNSGKVQCFPEVDRAQFFPLGEARRRIKDTQIPLLDRLESLLQSQGQR